jgi:hypothetical protein
LERSLFDSLPGLLFNPVGEIKRGVVCRAALPPAPLKKDREAALNRLCADLSRERMADAIPGFAPAPMVHTP